MKLGKLAAAFILLVMMAAPGGAQERARDKIDLPFVDDPQVVGAWESVDFVENPALFEPGRRASNGKLDLKELVFLPQGRTSASWWTWTKGVLIHHGDKTASKYFIKSIDGVSYLFLEWKNGDYVFNGRAPKYYVLRSEGPYRTDKIDLPFRNDPQVLGRWQSVDFVQAPGQFDPAHRAWQGELYLKDLTFLPDGKTPHAWWTWTKGVLIHHGDKTASQYELKTIGGISYMFLEWKSGDYVFRNKKPYYYVLRKAA